ncbi:hypothetical protein ACZ87_02398, partial [Candidatus Erwinia dacicola]
DLNLHHLDGLDPDTLDVVRELAQICASHTHPTPGPAGRHHSSPELPRKQTL